MSPKAKPDGSGLNLVDDPTPAIVAAAIALGALLAGLDYYQPAGAPLVVVVAVGITAIAFAKLLGWRVGVLVVLIVTSFIDRYTFSIGRVAIRPEQAAVLVAFAFIFFDRLRHGGWLSSFRLSRSEVALLGWFAVGLVSSVALAPARGQSLKILALLCISSLALFLPRRLVENDSQLLDRVVHWLLLAFAVEAAYTLVAYFLRLAGPIISLSVNPAGGHLNAYGTLWEPNVLGAVSGAGAVAWAYLGRGHFRRAWIGVALCLSAMITSFSRASWLAVVLVLLLALVLAKRARIEIRTLAIATAATLVVAAGVIAADRTGRYYQPVTPSSTSEPAPRTSFGGSNRLLAILVNGVDVLGRLYQFQTAFDDLKGSPVNILLGGGIDSYGERHTTAGRPQHIASLELAIVNDTGVLGLLVFLGLAALVAAEVWRTRADPRVTGLGAMVLVLALTNTSTETLELMITWLLLGLLLAATQVARVISAPGLDRTVRDIAS